MPPMIFKSITIKPKIYKSKIRKSNPMKERKKKLAEEISQMQTRLAEMEQELVGESEGEFEEGQWVVNNYSFDYLFKWTGENHATGFFDGDWGKWLVSEKKDGCRPATEDEIKEALVAEAKRRGLWPDTKIKGHADGVEAALNAGNYRLEYYPEDDVLWNKMGVVYHKGQWAEPVEDSVTINGVECEVKGDRIQFGCGDYVEGEDFKTFKAIVGVYDLKVTREGKDITPQIKKLGEMI